MADRMLICGVTGSGKSTLARKVGQRTGLPYYSVDDLTWEPGWVEVPPEEQRRRIAAICAGDQWVLDSAYRKWSDLVLDRVELIVALDYPRWRSLTRLARRTLRRALTKEPACNGNIETFRKVLSADSILVWHFRSFAGKRAQARAWATEPGRNVILLTSPRAADRWLAELPQTASDRAMRSSQ